jgi:two-component system cell cycle response regulator CtrA
MMPFPRRRFLHLAGCAAAFALLPAIARNAGAQPFPMRIGDLRIDLDTRGITINERGRLTKKEFELLKFLWLHEGKTLCRDVMLHHLYGGVDEPPPRIIDVFIAMLRFKIYKATDGRTSIRIDAVADHGYCCRGT